MNLDLGLGKGQVSAPGAEERGNKCVFGGEEQEELSPPSTSRAKGVVGAVPTQQRRQKAVTSASTVPSSEWNTAFCCWQLSSFGRFPIALPTGSCLFLSPQQASLSDMGHSSFLLTIMTSD